MQLCCNCRERIGVEKQGLKTIKQGLKTIIHHHAL